MDRRIGKFPRIMARRRGFLVVGIALVSLLWAGVIYKSAFAWRDARQQSDRLSENFAVMFEENVLRAIGEIDKSLLYMRRSLEGRRTAGIFDDLATTKDLLSEIIVQVAVIDAKGTLRASNAGPQPPPPTDLSDRPHFKAHLGETEDSLFIGQPMMGRTSKRMSVQFSRSFHAPDGSFGGVVVASLDPYRLTEFFNRVDFGSRAAVMIVGADGVVRSDGGADDGIALGADLTGTRMNLLLRTGHDGSVELPDQNGGGLRVVTTRKVRGQPLWVVVSVPKEDIYRDAEATFLIDTGVASVLTILFAFAMRKLLATERLRTEAERSMQRLAMRDPLTDLPNRRVFLSKLEPIAEEARTADRHYAVMFLDIDQFKFVNDTLGHGLGDQLLVEFSRRLVATLGSASVVARLGGDEFAVLLPTVTDRGFVDVLAKRICTAMAWPFELERHQIRSGVSVGIAIGPADGRSADEILIAADLALYAAKAVGRGGHHYYHRAMSDGLTERRLLEGELGKAVEGGQLQLHYQPSISLRSGRISSFEALARWTHPVRGAVPPSLFISIAEDCGLIHAIGAWALTEACREATRWPVDVKVAVNLSPVQFAGPDLVATVEAVLARTGLPAGRLELEITEQMLLDKGERTLRTLRLLKALGVSIAMDDFGTGYSSLTYLRDFPFDRVKVDRSFVADLGRGAQQTAIVRAVIDIARSAGMATTAEGVETAEQRDELIVLGCSEVQGYFYSPPVPVSGVPGLIAGWPEVAILAA